MQTSFTFAASLPTEEESEKNKLLNYKVVNLAFWDKEKKLIELLKMPGVSDNITAATIGSAMYHAMWDESIGIMGALLNLKNCALEEVQTIYSMASQYFRGDTETKKMLRSHIIKLSGKDPDAEEEFAD